MCNTTRKFKMFLIIIVLIGAFNWGLIGLLNTNLVASFSSLFGENSFNVSKIIYVMVGLSALILIFERDTYLPFLGETVYPNPMNDYKPSGDTITKKITGLPANTKIIYWAAESSNKIIDNPYDAYNKYTNQGVTTSDNEGNAILTVRPPAQYEVGMKGRLNKHIHYRFWTQDGMASRLYTINI